MADTLNNLRIETAGTQEEAVLEMEVGDTIKGEEGGGGTLREMGALEFLTQDTEPSGTTLVDALNWSNKLSRLAILWTVRHRWPAGVRSAFN